MRSRASLTGSRPGMYGPIVVAAAQRRMWERSRGGRSPPLSCRRQARGGKEGRKEGGSCKQTNLFRDELAGASVRASKQRYSRTENRASDVRVGLGAVGGVSVSAERTTTTARELCTLARSPKEVKAAVAAAAAAALTSRGRARRFHGSFLPQLY